MKAYKVYFKDNETKNKLLHHARDIGYQDCICMLDDFLGKFLFFKEDGRISYGYNFEYFKLHANEELTADEFLSLKREKSKVEEAEEFYNEWINSGPHETDEMKVFYTQREAIQELKDEVQELKEQLKSKE